MSNTKEFMFVCLFLCLSQLLWTQKCCLLAIFSMLARCVYCHVWLYTFFFFSRLCVCCKQIVRSICNPWCHYQTCLPLRFCRNSYRFRPQIPLLRWLGQIVWFFLSRILSWSKITGTGSKLSKGQNQVMTGNYFPWNTDCAWWLLKLLLPPSLKWALSKRCVEDSGLTTQKKITAI